jgi:hypothetical protein
MWIRRRVSRMVQVATIHQRIVATAKGDKCDEEKQICSHCGKIGHTTTRSRQCTFTSYKSRAKKGKFHLVHVAVPMYPYVVTWIMSVLTLRSCLLTGNSGNESAPKTDSPAIDSPAPNFGKDSKNVYINNSFNLDTIPRLQVSKCSSSWVVALSNF